MTAIEGENIRQQAFIVAIIRNGINGITATKPAVTAREIDADQEAFLLTTLPEKGVLEL